MLAGDRRAGPRAERGQCADRFQPIQAAAYSAALRGKCWEVCSGVGNRPQVVGTLRVEGAGMTWGGYVAFSALSVVTFAISKDFRGVATRMHKMRRTDGLPRALRPTSPRSSQLFYAVLSGIFIALVIFSAALAALRAIK